MELFRAGRHLDLRRESLQRTVEIGFDGYAIGGLSVGEEKSVMWSVVDEIAPALPAEQPRYLMGVGTPEDLVEAVARGVDMFDCVLPTRNGRTGQAFTSRRQGQREERAVGAGHAAAGRIVSLVQFAGDIRARTCVIFTCRAKCWRASC